MAYVSYGEGAFFKALICCRPNTGEAHTLCHQNQIPTYQKVDSIPVLPPLLHEADTPCQEGFGFSSRGIICWVLVVFCSVVFVKGVSQAPIHSTVMGRPVICMNHEEARPLASSWWEEWIRQHSRVLIGLGLVALSTV